MLVLVLLVAVGVFLYFKLQDLILGEFGDKYLTDDSIEMISVGANTPIEKKVFAGNTGVIYEIEGSFTTPLEVVGSAVKGKFIPWLGFECPIKGLQCLDVPPEF